MDRTDTSLIALRRILRATELYGRRLARESGLTQVQFRVLQVIAEKGHATPTDIAGRMGVSQPTITSLVNKLVAKRMVARQRSHTDRRQTDVVITETGHAAVERAPDTLQENYVRKFEALEDWEQAMLVAALERVAALLDADEIDASPLLDTGDIQRGP